MIYAGIDAGGTSSKCMIVNKKNEVLARVKTGPANYQIVGIDTAVMEIRRAVELACNKAGIDIVDFMGLGIAGAGSSSDLEKIKEKLLPLKTVKEAYITDDGKIAVLGAHNGKPGIVLIAGTGSIVYGLTENYQTVRAGGWGPLLGDEGSGFWIGLQAVKYIIKAKEGRGIKTSLEKPILNHLCLNDLRGLVTFTHQMPLPRKQIAELAPVVIEEMLNNDQVAKDIINKGLYELSLAVKVVADKINSNSIKISVMGGLFSNKYVYEMFINMIFNNYGFKVIHPKHSAVYGAILYGALKGGQIGVFI